MGNRSCWPRAAVMPQAESDPGARPTAMGGQPGRHPASPANAEAADCCNAYHKDRQARGFRDWLSRGPSECEIVEDAVGALNYETVNVGARANDAPEGASIDSRRHEDGGQVRHVITLQGRVGVRERCDREVSRARGVIDETSNGRNGITLERECDR